MTGDPWSVLKIISQRRVMKGKIDAYIPPHRWKNGKAIRHPGYWRKIRPKGNRLKVGKKPVKLYPIRDNQGYFRGWKVKQK